MAAHDALGTPAEAEEVRPLPRVVPLPTAATDAFLARPVVLFGLSARQVLHAVARGRYDATAERRVYIEAALERLADLRDKLVAKLDALDADPDLEPFLSAVEHIDQRGWATCSRDDREVDDDFEPSLGSIGAMNQRAWGYGGCGDLEWEHDGREPSLGWGAPKVGSSTPWLTDGGLGEDIESAGE